jgi:hypothetical protein
MDEVLKEIQTKFCKVCKVGAPSKLIGYKSSGTCLDYIYDNFKVPYSLAWEIYSNEVPFVDFEGRTEEKIHNNPFKIDKNSLLDKIKMGGRLFTSNKFNFSNKLSSISSSSSFLEVQQVTKVSNFSKSFLRPKIYSSDENEMCVKLFNPLTKSSYNFVIDNWTKALIHLLNYVKIN